MRCAMAPHMAVLLLVLPLQGLGRGLLVALAYNMVSELYPGESILTVSAVPTIQSFGIACGAAIAGLVANTAGLATDISPATVAAAATWVYRLGIIAPAALALLGWRLVWLYQRQQHGTSMQNVRAEY